MDRAPSLEQRSVDTFGIALSLSNYEALRDLCDELQLLVALTATTHPIDDEILPVNLKRAALAGYLRGVAERIENALEEGDGLSDAPAARLDAAS
ncbi:XAC0095 family protein [Dyella sp. KULCS107]|uniref:XAC0095 family protein n=1 Tax=Dyella sp. KULCS107 TaxID=3422216 RepID=UPI003D6EF131